VAASAALAGALVALALYHAAFVAPRLRRLAHALAVHDELLGGAAGRASERLGAAERAIEDGAARQQRTDERLAELERIARVHVPRIGFVRYNAFEDVGSNLSYALALLNKDGDGVVINSIYSREDTRTYGKAVRGYTSVTDASKEELAAIEAARAAAL
jgi:hypothetical protein